ncbi:eCIS core domain-containing protein [Nostoc sp.]|uniref:eCIS core domain-containing protein n=1 Tax=Nostoc sp. TaxID=1180 RepID=UPI002FF34694
MQEPKQDKNATTKTDRQQTAVKNLSRNGQGIAASPLDPLVQQVSRMGNAPNPSAHAAILNRAPANQQSSNRQLLLQLQQQYGNPYVNQVLQLARGMGGEAPVNTTEKPLMQAKLTIGSVGDKYEQEADRTAQLVVQRMNAPSQPDRSQVIGREAMPEAELQKKPEISTIQRQEMPKEKEEEQQAEVKQETDSLQLQKKCGGCEKKEEDNLAQMKPETGTFPQEELPKDEEKEELTMQLLAEHQPAEGGMAATPKLETSIQQKRGKGQPLSDKLREPMEQAFGKDFSGVRVHADAQSDQINRSIQARAFTTGQDIFFKGEYASGSKQGQELLAHELTHVVQQNGSAIKAKTEEGVTLSELSPDARVQRLCSNCEKEEKPENTLQAKEVSSGTLAVAPEPEVSISQVTQPAIQRVFDDLPDRREPKAPKQEKEKQPEAPEETAESDTSDCDQQGDANKPQPEAQQEEQQPEKCPSEKEDKGKKQPKPEKTKPLKDKLSEKPASCVRQEQNPILQAFAPIPTATPNLTARSAITTATNTSTPQQNLQATGETASPETATEKVQATTTATEAQGQLRTTDAEVARLASSKINFKLPKQEETDTDNNSAALEEQRAAASSMASNFFAEAALRIQTVTGLGQSISARINGVAENAKASVMSTVQQQQDAVAAQINQQRTQVNSQAQRSIAEIQQQYQATLRNISLRTAEVSQRIQTEYSNAFQKVDQGETNLLSRVDQLYIQTYDQYIAAGDTVGNEATAVGEKWVKQWESEITDKYSNEDAVFEDRGHMRSTPPNPGKTVEVVKNGKLGKKASTAKEVAKQYKEQVTEEATKQANNLVKGKAKDIKGICCAIKEFRKQLQKQQEETLKAVIDLQQDAVLQVTEAQTKLTESANQTLQATLQSLDEQETAQLQILQGYGDRQVLAIERDAQKAIASLQKGVNQAANKLLTALQDYYSEFQGMEAPNSDELSVTLAEILGQFDSSIGTVQKETEKGIAVSEDGIAQGEQQAVDAVGAIAQTVMEESAAVVEEAKTSFNNLDRGITNTFNQLRDAYTQAANKFVEATAKGLAQITQNSQNPLEQIYQKLSEALQKSVTQIETGLRDTLKCLETDIQNYAAKAVEDEPWWKSLLKALVFIVVIVVAIVLAPIGIGFVAGALGGGIAATIFASVVVGAALGAGLGALSQIANNAIDGKNLMDGVGKAALAGAIGGAVGGFGGVLGGVLGNVGKLGVGLSKTWSKFGIESVFDTLGNIFGDLAAGNPITLEGVLMGAAIGAGTYVATTKGTLRRLGKPGEKIQSFQERSSEAGMRSGAFVGGKVKSAFGGKVDTSAGSRSGVDGRSAKPSETEVKAPKTSVPSGQRVDIPTVSRPDVDVNTPIIRPDVGKETPRGFKPDTDLRMTQREQEILENTASKDGDKLTREELKTELEVAGKAKRKPINEGEYVEEIELPNSHKLKQRRSDGGWCRFSDRFCMPENLQPVETNFTYVNAVVLERNGVNNDKEQASNFKIEKINFPKTLRPPTQFGVDQKAHSISWTLLKKSYTNIEKNITLANFIENYLKKDWAALAKQNKYTEKDISSHRQLEIFFEKYTDEYFDDLKTKSLSPLEWHEKIQLATTDYLIALQLAPLSTHVGNISTDNQKIKEAQPSAHGESDANTFFNDLETRLENNNGNQISQNTEEVIKNAFRYLDLGNQWYGIKKHGEPAKNLILNEFYKTFQRANPKTWEKYGEEIKKAHLLNNTETETLETISTSTSTTTETEISETLETISTSTSATTGTETKTSEITNILVKNFPFQIQLVIAKDQSTTNNLLFSAEEYKMKAIYLTADRLYTKFGTGGQKSHTVAWILTLQRLQNQAKGKNVKEFLQNFQHQWQLLKEQNWSEMINKNLIVFEDFTKKMKDDTLATHNENNKNRLLKLEQKLDFNIERIREALKEDKKGSDLQWNNFIQETISDYVEVYQSAPLTTFRRGTARGKGEGDAIKKIRAWEEQLRVNNPPTIDKLKMLKIALKLLDVKWNIFLIPSKSLEKDSLPKMATILYEWETGLKEAYPNIWAKYRETFQDYTNNYNITEPLLNKLNQNENNMKYWMEQKRKQDDINSIRK